MTTGTDLRLHDWLEYIYTEASKRAPRPKRSLPFPAGPGLPRKSRRKRRVRP